MSQEQYLKIVQSLNSLLQVAKEEAAFSDAHLDEVREFINVSEYGLALQTFVDIIKEEKLTLTSNVRRSCMEVASLMGLKEEIEGGLARLS